MKIKELVDKLNEFDQDAEISVIAHCQKYPFTLSWGGAESQSKETAKSVNFYVDELCTNERQNN